LRDAELRRLVFRLLLEFPTARDDAKRVLTILTEVFPAMFPQDGGDHPLNLRR
jgi:hypothetical protein